ncbi:hypothetical protein B0H13DRAFT_2652227 [Mycena leptocephala]|nr:hypothetical protein B0H13DRAFT_2652227 [Mycena leptocephala]
MARPRARYFDEDMEIRASVYDVFLELGAMDANSRIADWIFADPGSDVPGVDDEGPRAAATTGGYANAVAESSRSRQKPPPPPPSKTFAQKFSPGRITTWSRATPPATPPRRSPLERSPSGDGYETDEGYASASSPDLPTGKKKPKARARAVFSSSPAARASPAPPPKPPPLPPIREALQRAASAPTTTTTTRSLLRKNSKQPVAPDAQDDLEEQWLEVGRLTPRIFNPSALNGVPLAPPSSFRAAAADTSAEAPRRQSLTQTLTPLPRRLIRTLSMSKRRPPSLALNNPAPGARPRYASSLPPSPFILVTADSSGERCGGEGGTPFAFLTPTPLRSRFSDATALLSPFSGATALGPVYPLSLRRSMVLDGNADHYYAARPRSSSCTSLQSLYELYDRPTGISPLQRGREAPFPVRPVLPHPLSVNANGLPQRYCEAKGVATTLEATMHEANGGENTTPEARLATIERYRAFSRYLDGVTVGASALDRVQPQPQARGGITSTIMTVESEESGTIATTAMHESRTTPPASLPTDSDAEEPAEGRPTPVDELTGEITDCLKSVFGMSTRLETLLEPGALYPDEIGLWTWNLHMRINDVAADTPAPPPPRSHPCCPDLCQRGSPAPRADRSPVGTAFGYGEHPSRAECVESFTCPFAPRCRKLT